MTDIAKRKELARKQMFARRKEAHDHKVGLAACDHLLDHLFDKAPQVISGYMPIRTEIDILPAMTRLAQRHQICVPVVTGAARPLEFHAWHPKMEMVEGAFGAAIPATGEILTPTKVILPLLAFDSKGYRLGYGGGFYDRTLEKLRANSAVTTLGFAYSAQEMDDVPTEPTDQKLDAIITEHGIWHF